MSFLSWLFKKKEETPPELDCPRCLGKGYLNKNDISRLRKEGKWEPGTCAYCKGTGGVDEEMLTKVPADAEYLTLDLSEEERQAVIEANHWGGSFPLDEKREGCPVTEHNRLWLEEAFGVLTDLFGANLIKEQKVLVPDYTNFPIQYDGSEESAYKTLEIVAAQMDVPVDIIELGFIVDGGNEIGSGGVFGGRIYTENDKETPKAVGLYEGMDENGVYQIWLSSKTLHQPENMVATLAHEIAHIKLLGENRIDENNEYLTDLTTIVFGLGIFNANSAFRSYKDANSFGWQSSGYLSQVQWGYALALYAHLRNETSPDWINHLTKNVKADFLRGQTFIEDNPELLFIKGIE